MLITRDISTIIEFLAVQASLLNGQSAARWLTNNKQLLVLHYDKWLHSEDFRDRNAPRFALLCSSDGSSCCLYIDGVNAARHGKEDPFVSFLQQELGERLQEQTVNDSWLFERGEWPSRLDDVVLSTQTWSSSEVASDVENDEFAVEEAEDRLFGWQRDLPEGDDGA